MSRPPNLSTIDNEKKYKLVVVGDGFVGKSALSIQFFQRTFVEDHDPTIEDSYIQRRDIDGELCLLDVLDTAGQNEYGAMREQYMRKGDGFMIVYSVIDQGSFEHVRRFHTQILRVKDKDLYPMTLVANKVDLVSQRKVTEEEGRNLASELHMSYIETSAKSNTNVDAAFIGLVQLIKSEPAPKPEAKPHASRRKRCTLL